MSAPSLRTALARLRQQAEGGTSGTTSAAPTGSTPAGAETQQPQGFAEGGTTGTSGTIENVALRKFPPATPAEAEILREWLDSVVPVVPPVPGQHLRGIGPEPPADAALVPLVPPPDWTDDRAWCRRLSAAGARANRIPIVREWVTAAGGWSDAGAVHIPEGVHNGLALATLKAHARALGLAVHTDPDDPAMMLWLGGKP